MSPSQNLNVDILKKMPGFNLKAQFTITDANKVSLIAKSGSGKSTLLKLISGLLPLDQGRIQLSGRDITNTPPNLRNIGFIFQESALFPSLNVIDNISFGLIAHKIQKKLARELSMEYLKKINLEHLALRSIETLSGGEKQRIAFLRAFIWKPELILLDEPFSSLDEHSKENLSKLLLELHQAHPVPLLFITHDKKDAQNITNTHFTIIETGNNREVVQID